MLHDHAHLENHKDHADWHDTPDFKGDPEISREITPNNFVDDCEEEKEETPANGEFLPTFII